MPDESEITAISDGLAFSVELVRALSKMTKAAQRNQTVTLNSRENKAVIEALQLLRSHRG